MTNVAIVHYSSTSVHQLAEAAEGAARKAGAEVGNPYGASSVIGGTPGRVHNENLAAIEFQARRTMQVAAALVRGGIEAVA
jgi:hypothetical protein